MRGKIYNHPDLKYIITLLKKNTPHTEIADKVNKRAKGEQVTRHSIGRFAKSYASQLEKKTGDVVKAINKAKEAEIAPQVVAGEIYIEEQLMPASETLELLFNNGVAFAQTVLEEVKYKERDMKDFKTLIDSLNNLNELKKELNNNTPEALIGANEYEKYMLDIECEEGER